MTVLEMIFLGVLAGVAFLCALWLLVPAFYGLPWVPTRSARIRRALALANLRPGERLYDLGAGDGRVLLMAARDFGAQAIGVEVGPAQCLLGWLRIRFSGNRQNVRMRCGDFYHADMSEADVVFVYLTSTQTSRLEKKLARELRPGARVVSISADFPGWQPSRVDREALVFLYEMPQLSENSTKSPP